MNLRGGTMSNKTNIFREKSIEKISSPDQMDDYIKVMTPSVWIGLIALVVLLVGILVWCTFGTMETHDEEGNVKDVHPITYVTN